MDENQTPGAPSEDQGVTNSVESLQLEADELWRKISIADGSRMAKNAPKEDVARYEHVTSALRAAREMTAEPPPPEADAGETDSQASAGEQQAQPAEGEAQPEAAEPQETEASRTAAEEARRAEQQLLDASPEPDRIAHALAQYLDAAEQVIAELQTTPLVRNRVDRAFNTHHAGAIGHVRCAAKQMEHALALYRRAYEGARRSVERAQSGAA